MDDKLLVGVIGALAGGSFTIVASYLSARYRMKEIEYKILQRSAIGSLAAARSKLNEIYVPLNEKIEALDDSFRKFQKTKAQQDKVNFLASFQGLKTFYDTIKQSGETLFLVPEIHDEVEYVLTLIDESQSATSVTSVVISKMEMLGLRAVSNKRYPQWFALLFYLILILFNKIRMMIRFSSSVIFIDTTLRTYSAPLDSEDFNSEFLLSISAIRSRAKEIALSKEIPDIQAGAGTGTGS